MPSAVEFFRGLGLAQPALSQAITGAQDRERQAARDAQLDKFRQEQIRIQQEQLENQKKQQALRYFSQVAEIARTQPEAVPFFMGQLADSAGLDPNSRKSLVELGKLTSSKNAAVRSATIQLIKSWPTIGETGGGIKEQAIGLAQVSQDPNATMEALLEIQKQFKPSVRDEGGETVTRDVSGQVVSREAKAPTRESGRGIMGELIKLDLENFRAKNGRDPSAQEIRDIRMARLSQLQQVQARTQKGAESIPTPSQEGRQIIEGRQREEAATAGITESAGVLGSLEDIGERGVGFVAQFANSFAGVAAAIPGGRPVGETVAQVLTGSTPADLQEFESRSIRQVSALLTQITKEESRFTDFERKIAADALASLQKDRGFDQIRRSTMVAVEIGILERDRGRRLQGEQPLFDLTIEDADTLRQNIRGQIRELREIGLKDAEIRRVMNNLKRGQKINKRRGRLQ